MFDWFKNALCLMGLVGGIVLTILAIFCCIWVNDGSTVLFHKIGIAGFLGIPVALLCYSWLDKHRDV